MPIFARVRSAALWGLGFAGLAALVVPSAAQQTDPNVRKASNANPGAGRAVSAQPLMMGTIDLEKLFDEKTGYVRIRDETAVFNNAFKSQNAELAREMAEIQASFSQLERLNRDAPDYREQETRAAELGAKFEAKKSLAQRDFASKKAELMAVIYTDIQRITAVIAQRKGLAFVVQSPASALSRLKEEPTAVGAVMSQSVVYSDPKTDITPEVLAYLNDWYVRNRTPAPAAPVPAPAAPQPSQTQPQPLPRP